MPASEPRHHRLPLDSVPVADVSEGSSSAAVVTAAVREAGRFDGDLVSVRAGLLSAIPVVAVLGGALAANDPVAGATMGAGAMLVGIAWHSGGGRPPLAMMATDAVLMGCATFVGSVTGSVAWLHLLVLSVWSLLAGLLVCLGRPGTVVGTQAMIAAVVFGRFGEPPGGALGLAGLVFAGGCAQVLFVALARWPSPLRAQREAAAGAYQALSALAGAPASSSTLPAAAALDEARATLSSPHLFGDPALSTLRALINEGNRIRVALSVVNGLVGRDSESDRDRPSHSAVVDALSSAADSLSLAAKAIEGDPTAAPALSLRAAEVTSAAGALSNELHGRPADPNQDAVSLHLTRRLSALAGQLRAIATLAPAAGEGGGLLRRRPHGRTNRPLERLREDLAQIRANASLQSPAGRHAIRLAVVVLVAELIAGRLPLAHGYWMVVAAAAVLRPDFTSTFRRGAERALGTCAGVALAGAIAVAVKPGDALTVVLVGLLAWAAYATFPASFAAGFGFITALVVFLLNVVNPDTLGAASARLLDTMVGSVIGLLAYALWPTWSKAPARQALAKLVDAQRSYLVAVLAAVISGRRPEDQQMRSLARQARLAATSADATVAQSLSEPATRRIDPERSQGSLTAVRRLVQSVHTIRLDAQDDRDHRPFPALAPLAHELDAALAQVDATIRAQTRDGSQAFPDLRTAYEAFERRSRGQDDHDRAALLSELDEIVDATNSLATLSGLDPLDTAAQGAQGR